MNKGKATLSFVSCKHYSATIPFCNRSMLGNYFPPDTKPTQHMSKRVSVHSTMAP